MPQVRKIAPPPISPRRSVGVCFTKGENMNFTGRADWVAFVACIALVVLCVVYQVAAL